MYFSQHIGSSFTVSIRSDSMNFFNGYNTVVLNDSFRGPSTVYGNMPSGYYNEK